MNIYLVGMMGSGKTTLGKQLARSLGYTFIDLDHYLVEHEKMTIPEIFQQKGETYFRERESFYLKKVGKSDKRVIATGGGAPCFYDNMDFMNQHGTTLFLNVSAQAICERLKSQKAGRPLVSEKSDQELLDFVKQTLVKRKPFYKRAQLEIKGDFIQHMDLLKKLGHI